MFFNNTFVLASSSTSRYKILKNNKLSFVKKKPRCNEEFLKKELIKKNISPKKISLELARLKSKSISEKIKNELIIGCDTVIDFEGSLLQKARSLKEAKIKITKLSGKSHIIYSSVSAFFNNKEVWRFSQKSQVKIRKLTEKEIDKYLSGVGVKILSSIGCYQVELEGPSIIEGIKGDFFNVMGFPLFPFLIFLKKHNIQRI